MFCNFLHLLQIEGRLGDYQTPYGWQEVEMTEGNIAELQPR